MRLLGADFSGPQALAGGEWVLLEQLLTDMADSLSLKPLALLHGTAMTWCVAPYWKAVQCQRQRHKATDAKEPWGLS